MHQVNEETAIRIQTGASWARPGGLNAKRKPTEIRLGGMPPLEGMKWRKQGLLARSSGNPREHDAEAARSTHDEIEFQAALADGAIQWSFISLKPRFYRLVFTALAVYLAYPMRFYAQ
ncbi:uncharacterized protein N7498_009070 [Penicillium cinerascens]|uniref:Uncharacterized protein n=1 Tax=Penicillium cinerascens TaxID=70096 RepID=A0A9W9JG06_9EURO|nr:uncharacterized protein N7498_009070 [Penicillium cinerascens]KAJ5195632.1 hypothetical protein N7498_009070 [Penicillium cinerascens]